MPNTNVAARELGSVLGVLSHPHRLQIIEELNEGELDVNTLQGALGISHSGVSQHLSILRAHRVVSERRVGRRVFYHLRDPELAKWLVAGLAFIEREASEEVRSELEQARIIWSGGV